MIFYSILFYSIQYTPHIIKPMQTRISGRNMAMALINLEGHLKKNQNQTGATLLQAQIYPFMSSKAQSATRETLPITLPTLLIIMFKEKRH